MSERVRAVVAVVDDDPRILESLGDLLESAGHEVRIHASGSALLSSEISSIDCVITDIGMPEMDGFELRRRLKQARPELPVVLVSGRREQADEKQLQELGEHEFFRKPFDGSALLAALEAALQRHTR